MKKLAAFVFPGFQTLDFFGPIEMLGGLPDEIEITLVAETLDPVPSVHGHKILPEKILANSNDYDLLFIPGGDAALIVAENKAVSDWLIETAANAELVMTVCTGSVLLATTGVLDGHKATTNKLDFTQTIPLGPKVDWVEKARWVEDGKFFTSSGVSAGMDMALAAIAHLYGREVAKNMAVGTEYEWHEEASWDPFSSLAGLG
jgi:transcriptional regulator GlxA family with amidase domain